MGASHSSEGSQTSLSSLSENLSLPSSKSFSSTSSNVSASSEGKKGFDEGCDEIYVQCRTKYHDWHVINFLIQKSELDNETIEHIKNISTENLIGFMSDIFHAAIIVQIEKDYDRMNVLIEFNKTGCKIEINHSVKFLRELRTKEIGLHEIQPKQRWDFSEICDRLDGLIETPYHILINNCQQFAKKLLKPFARCFQSVEKMLPFPGTEFRLLVRSVKILKSMNKKSDN